MRTKIYGVDDDTVILESTEETIRLPAKDAIVKIWLSGGTIIGIKYSKGMIYENVWKVRLLYGPYSKHIMENSEITDIFHTDEHIVNWKVIPRTYYEGVL